MSFWRAENKIPIVQTSHTLTAQNGLEFSAGQQIVIEIPPTSIKFFQPKETYLNFDFKLKAPSDAVGPTRLQLDSELGGQALIKTIRLLSHGGVLLEEIQNYNVMKSVINSYNTDDTLKAKRSLTENSTTFSILNKGTNGGEKSMCADTMTNPYFKPIEMTGTDAQTIFTDDDFLVVKMCLQLHTGIFSSDKVYPNLLTGLRLEIELEDADKVVQQLDSVNRWNKLTLNPVFDSVEGEVADSNWISGNASSSNTFYCKIANSCHKPEHQGFVIGEKISFVNVDNGSFVSFKRTSDGAAYVPAIAKINASSGAPGGTHGLLQITLDDAVDVDGTAPGDDITRGGYYMVSQSLKDAGQPSYVVSNVEMVVQELDMGSGYEADMLKRMKEGGVMNLDILSCTNYRYSQLQSDLVATMRLPIDNSRCRSIWCVPTSSKLHLPEENITGKDCYDVSGHSTTAGTLPQGNGDGTTYNTRASLVGVSDNLQKYNFFYGGRLQPSRKVSVAKTSSKYSIDAMPCIEQEKALVQADVPARSFASFNKNFFIGRSFSLNQGVEDLRNQDFTLQLEYGTQTTPKLWNNFLWHLRSIVIRGDDVSVQV